MAIIPLFLEPGQKVALVSPAGCIGQDCIDRGLRVLQSWGLCCQTGKNALKRFGPFAGNDQERLEDFQQALDDPEIHAIFCTRGGYGSARIIDRLDFSGFLEHPKWIVGFSDITVILSHLQQNLNCAGLHAAMPQTYPETENGPYSSSVGSLYKALFGQTLAYRFKGQALNRSGTVKAPIIGGNLSILYSQRGTPTDLDPTGKILFIEDIAEYDYHIDRMLMNLKRSGWFDRIAGLIVGTFTQIKKGANPYIRDVWEIIESYTKDYDYPVCYGFPAGHVPHNHALYMGVPALLEVSNSMDELSGLGFYI